MPGAVIVIADAFLPLALDSGMREGELLALRWRDVDLVTGSITVIASASEVRNEALGYDGRVTIRQPKSGKGRRIDISRETVEALKRRKKVALREGLGSCEWVFPTGSGDVYLKSNFLYQVWRPIREAAELPGVRFHDLRHACAIALLLANVHAKIVQERLGHSSIALTLDTYGAYIPSLQKDAADAMGETLGRLLNPKPKKRAA